MTKLHLRSLWKLFFFYYFTSNRAYDQNGEPNLNVNNFSPYSFIIYFSSLRTFCLFVVCTALCLTNALAATKTWNGSVSTDWGASGNWSPAGRPLATDDVIIPAGVMRYPIVDLAVTGGTVSIQKTLVIQNGGSLTIGTASIAGDNQFILDDNGVMTIDAGGTVTLIGSSSTAFVSYIYVLGTLNNSGNIILNKNGDLYFDNSTPTRPAIINCVSGTVTINNGGLMDGKGTYSGCAYINPAGGLIGTNGDGYEDCLTFSNGLTNNGTMNFDLGTGCSGNSDKVTVTGTATLGGTCAVNASSVNINDVFTIITATSINGTFTNSTVNLGGGKHANIYYTSTTVQIKIESSPLAATPTVNLSVSTNTGTEAAATVVTVTATASTAVSGAQTVNLAVTGTVTSGDYTLNNTTTNSVTITIPNGETTGTATFKVVDDAAVEGEETATLTISSPSSGITLGSTTTRDIAKTDNDLAPFVCPTLSATSSTSPEICSADNTSDITLTSTSNTLDMKLVYFTSAQSGTDMYTGGTAIGSTVTPSGGSSPYTVAFNNLTFPANNTSSNVTYYVYAILDVADAQLTDAGCRPSVAFTVTVKPTPQVFTVSGGGAYCPGGTDVRINISDTEPGDLEYQIFKNSVYTSTVMYGDGEPQYFGAFDTFGPDLDDVAGTYTLVAVGNNGCTSNMAGSAIVTIGANAPQDFIISGGGEACAGGTGVPIILDNSETGINYQLTRDLVNVGSSVAGTGSELSLGNHSTAGAYMIIATNSSGCTKEMNGGSVVDITPAATVTPSVSVNRSPSGAITIGTSVTFTATPTNGGTTPAYQWKKNNDNVGTNSNTYTDATLLNGDVITCVMTPSSDACASPATATSTEITMSVTEPAALCITTTCTGFEGTYTKGAAYNGRLTFPDGKGHTIFYANPNWVLVNGTASPTSVIVFEAPSTAVLPPVSGWGASEDADCFEATLTLVQGSCVTCETPTAFTVGGGGTYCTSGTGVSITLSSSQNNTSYQLKRNGNPVGTPKTGTGAALTFGPEKFAAGTYTIEASVSGGSPISINNSAARVATDACTAPMNGSVTVTSIDPPIADAGANKTTCGQTAVALAASTGVVIDFIPDASTARMGATTGTWSGGAGMFSNTSSPTSTYTPAASEVGTTVTLTWTVAGTAPCTNATDQMTVTVTRPTTTASLSVLGNATGCAGSANTPKVVFTGAGGTAPYTFTYTINGGAPQTITTTSGNSVQLAHPTSTAGTFVYSLVSVVDNIGCRQSQSGTVSITIEAPAAGGIIVYNNNPFCANAGTATVTRTAPAGGTYSCDTPGLSLNATTGAVNLAASTPGTYLVKYTIVGPCTNMTTTANITINAAPTATIAYANSPYCAGSGTANVTLTGKTGGVFSSTTGMNINANTGAINLATSTSGSYVVTYTIAAANGCGELKTTANVSITTAPTATIAYANSPYCSNAGTASVTLTGSQGGTFSSTTGLSINANTGAIDLAASTAGSYVVTYTIAAANGCTEFKTTANVTITAAPTATIAYSNSPYCAGSGTATVTLTGRTGGVFSSTSGLSIDANTGAINLATSTAGTYVVTYTIAAVNGCGELTTTANVTITTTPSATIAYANTPYCSNAGTASVTLTGSQGGTFSTTAGLSINVATGEINLVASTAGTYVVTYTIPAANGCAEYKTTANVSITAAPAATIVYSNSPYCAGAGTATVTLTGTTGGVFSSTSGLSINANTGAIDLAASTAGSYLVTYTIAAANGCAELKTTVNVSITTTPSATIAYANTPYCANVGTASVTLTGSQGGTFSSIAGLAINVATGAIDLAASTSGTYVVTYTIAAANGCSELKTTANVTITTAPKATITYSGTPYCAGSGTASVTLTGTTGGVFSSTSGLSINANTGAINLAASTAGTYVVTYTIAAANGCGELKTTASVTITTTPSATIAYANTPYCANVGTASVTLTGSQGGTFSSIAGLSINANTGAIDLAASTAGTYVVTYTIPAANGCPEFKTTANVSITAAPTATIAYSNSPYCANAGTASVTLTGTTGGVFSSTSGLSIDANTGAINLATSNAGSYVVTYTIAAANGCGELKATTNVTVQSVLAAPVISSNQSSSVCMGTEVLLYTNCPQGSTVLWSNNSTATILALNATSPSEQTITVKCQGAGVCESPASAAYTVKWSSTFSLTLINVGKSQSAIKENNAPKSSWSSQFITPDAGPTIETSTEANPTIYYSENMNKTAPRYWTIHAETCNLGTAGSLTFDMLAKDEQGVERSYNTHENSAPYLMYANRSGFTELYAQNHPLYGFYQDNGSGGNVYDAGLPKGFYKLAVRYWDLKGWGSIYPATRKPQGNVLAYQEFWFRIQSKDGIGTGAARIGSDNGQRITDNGAFAQVMPNPVSNVLRLKVTDAKSQKVNVSLMDASGRTLLQRAFVPETNQHQEEFNASEMANGMYFLKVNAGEKQATLKVVKVQ